MRFDSITMGATTEESLRRQRRKGSYHLAVAKNKLPNWEDLKEDEEEDNFVFKYLTSTSLYWQRCKHTAAKIRKAKEKLFLEIVGSNGETKSSGFEDAFCQLHNCYDATKFDARKSSSTGMRMGPPRRRVPPARTGRAPPSRNRVPTRGVPTRGSGLHPQMQEARQRLEGMWMTLSKPNHNGFVGYNEDDDYMYTLGRMSFDMFRPTGLVCSIQGTFNPIHEVHAEDREAIQRVPESLRAELLVNKGVLRTYDIVTAFTIEPHYMCNPNTPNAHVRRPIQGLMTTYGYALSNPMDPQRISVWFTGGSIEVSKEEDLPRWKQIFDPKLMPRRSMRESTNLLGAKLIMGAKVEDVMEADGKISYSLNRPIGGHDTAFIDTLYIDETLRVCRSTIGDVYVMARVPYFPDE